MNTQLSSKNWKIFVYAHTHWDREWYRTFERFRMQMVGMVDRVLDTLERDSAFTTFVLDGQTIVLDDYLEIRPEALPRIQKLVRDDRLHIGPWHVLPDEFLVSAESLVRNLSEGRRNARRFGKEMNVGYLPDPFGHIEQLPQLLQGFGIDNAIFSRGMGDEFVELGSEFHWQATDDSSVIAIVQSSPYTNGYCNFELAGRGNTSEDKAPYEAARDLAELLTTSAQTGMMLFAAGCDHETVQSDLPKIVAQLDEVVPNAAARLSGLDAVVEHVRDSAAELGMYKGELRGAYHAPILASIFSARVPIKQANDRVQTLLERHVEPLLAYAVAAGVRPARDIEPFIRHAWRLVLENHPHDSIGGCSIDAVHAEMEARTLRVEAIAHGLIEDLRIATERTEIALVHDSHGYGGLVERADGSWVPILPAKHGKLVPLDEQIAAAAATNEISDTLIRAGAAVVEVVADSRGELALFANGAAVTFVDDEDQGDEYDFGRVAGAERRYAKLVNYSTSDEGRGVFKLVAEFEIKLPQLHRITLVARVSAASPMPQFVVTMDNQAENHRLRIRLDTSDADTVTGDTPNVTALGHFALVQRAARPEEPQYAWKQDPPGLDHCLGAARLNSKLPLLIAGRGLHEYEAVPGVDGVLGLELTLLRSVGWLSRDDIAGRPGHAGPGVSTPGAQCIGPHRWDIAIDSGASARGVEAFKRALAFLQPPLVFEPFSREAVEESGALARFRDVLALAPPNADDLVSQLGIELDHGNAFHSTTKLADDSSGDLIIRWWAPSGIESATVSIRADHRVQAIATARIDETSIAPAEFDFDANQGSFQLAAGQVLTIRLTLG